MELNLVGFLNATRSKKSGFGGDANMVASKGKKSWKTNRVVEIFRFFF